jgi:branched-chain amino acid transport system substrate-binding protein
MGRRAGLGAATYLILLIVTVACGGAPPASPPPKVLHIGVDLPITGREARAARPALNGIRFFVQTHPTLDGFAVALTTTDDAGGGWANPTRGAANVQGFLADPNLVAMIGPFDSAVARKEIPIANEAGLGMVTPATSNPCLTRNVFVPKLLNPARTEITCRAAGLPAASDLRPAKNNNFFRLTATDELQGAAAADYAFSKLHVVRAAVITDSEVYGQGLADAFAARLASVGGTVLGHLDLDPKNPDATEFLKSMKGEGAQGIYYGGSTRGGGCAVRAQMKAVFTNAEATPFLGADGIAQDPACIKAAGDNGAGIYATVPIVDADTRAAAAATIRDFKVAFGNTADYGPYTIVAYDATAVLYAALDAAIRDAGGRLPERARVTAKLAQTAGLAGATGTLGFDAGGDTTNRIVSLFEATGADPRAPWKLVDAADYSARLPY